MAGELGWVAEVTGQEEDRVLLSIPMVGFPPGFQLRPGERVVLISDENGLTVRPLVRSLTVNDISEEGADTLIADNQRFAIQDSTIRGEGASGEGALDEGQPGPLDVFVLDSGSAGGPEQVLAVRLVRQSQ